MPDELLAPTEIEESARAKLADLRNALAAQTDLREVFLTLFPDGLTFTADRSPDGARQVWRITGEANFGSLVEPSGPDCVATPTGRAAIETGGCVSPWSSWPCGHPYHSRAAGHHLRRQLRSAGTTRTSILLVSFTIPARWQSQETRWSSGPHVPRNRCRFRHDDFGRRVSD
jgi:hypothetical protein